MSKQNDTHTPPPGGGENTPPTAPVPPVATQPALSRSERALLDDDSIEEFRAFRLGMHEELRPRGVLETTLVERYLMNQWRMQGCVIREAEIIAYRRQDATAYSNPRRMKTTPTAGQVWADDLEFHGGSLERLSKKEYKLSLEAHRIRRELAQSQKSRKAEEDAGVPDADGFEARMEASREAGRRKRATAGEPRNARIDTEFRTERGEAGQVIEQTEQSGNIQDELPVGGGKANSPANGTNPISHRAKPPMNETKPIRGEPARAPYDTDEVRAEIARRVSRNLWGPAGAPGSQRQTWVGSH